MKLWSLTVAYVKFPQIPLNSLKSAPGIGLNFLKMPQDLP